jgi:hypothetical protein
MSKKVIRLTEQDLALIIKKVLSEGILPTDKPYYIFSDAAKKYAITPGPSKFVQATPKASYFEIIMNPKPNGGSLLYDCSGVIKLQLGGKMGYQATNTVVYNDTLVRELNKSKYCKTGSYTNPDAYTQNDINVPSNDLDQSSSLSV